MKMNFKVFTNKLSNIYASNKSEGKKRHLFFVELLAIIGIYILAIFLWGNFVNPFFRINNDLIILGIINVVSWTILFKLTLLAKIPRTQRYINIFFNFVRVVFIELIFLFLVKFILGFEHVSIFFLVFYSGLNLFILFHLRILTYRIFKIFRAKGYDLHKVIVIANVFSDEFIEKVLNEKEWGFDLVKIVSNSRLIKEKFGDRIPVISENANLREILDHEVVDEVIYSKSDINKEEISNLIKICNEIGVIFRLQSDLSPLKTLKIQLDTLNEETQLSLTDTPANNFAQFLKFLGDLYFSFFMLLILSPIFIVVAILIKLDSRGPVFFAQERVGLRGRRFKIYKFRTMIVDAEKVLERLKEKNETDGPVFKIKDDPRITKIGKVLRKTGLDELPQLYNVFRGEMSLVGPRPPLPKEVEQYERWQLRRLSVRPGITCSWQVVPNRHNVKFESWMKMDLQYIDDWSFQKDIRLFFKTIKTFFTAGGH
jgi:exopolysaccharide biosynthesis polyprenyl glycosylphosphotransferase